MSLPSKKRKLSDEASLPPIDVTSPKAPAPRKDSGAGESATSDDTAAMALKALSALDAHAGRHPLKKRKASLDSSMESDHALGLAPLGAAAVEQQQQQHNDATTTSNCKEDTPPMSNKGSSTALDHLDALGDDAASLGSKQKTAKVKGVELTIGGDEGSGDSGLASSNQRLLLDALLSSNSAGTGGSSSTARRRDRLESWGGMSDLSATGQFAGEGGRLGDAAAALAASALHYTGLIEDVTAAARPRTGSIGSISSGEQNTKPSAVPSRISLAGDRKMSVASEFSMFGDGSGDQVAPHIQAFVDAAMASVGHQLEDLAGAVEMAAAGADVASVSSDFLRKAEAGIDSDVSSTVSPLIGPVSDLAAARVRTRSMSSSSKPLSVDYDAVAAAVNAAEVATSALDLSAIAGGMAPAPVPSVVLSNTAAASVSETDGKAGQKTSVGENDMEAIRARAREAAGYVPPRAHGTPEPRPPLKKRPKHPTPEKTPAAAPFPDVPESTPRISNISREFATTTPGARPYPPLTVSCEQPAFSAASRAASQKWDDMFESLVQFAKEKKAEALKGLSEKEKEEWEWDGNVPTTYKTPDGKALGRWVNNQRSAKTKGTLKPDREEKLLGTGMRWSIISTSSWQDMMNELLLYIEEKTKNGNEWDGNVPTSYKIKRKGNGEDKNLGRWVNRQRSQKQNGKLRKEREEALNAVGFRWQVLSTSSWDDMYIVLCEYVKERKDLDPKNAWDGNVPVNYKTNHKPPKALGRWVNRQRSNYGKNKVKKEHIEKLNALGFKWSVHERISCKPNAVPSSHVLVNKKVAPVAKAASASSQQVEGSSSNKDASNEASKQVSSSDSSSNGAVSSSAVAKENDDKGVKTAAV